jgi:hypothetical protein
VVLQLREQGGHIAQPALPQLAHLGTSASGLLHAVFQQLGAGMSPASSACPAADCPAEEGRSASHSLSLLRSDSSMLMRSMPSVYSAMRGSGITTSSLILKALVWRLMAAVRLRSSQNFLRASALTAMKPSPLRELAMRTTSLVARHGVGVVADDVADQHHLGQAAVALLALGGVAHGRR